ncbi:WecB/TagA/CpsF family glycosyltransferase [Azotosporobacter soli]|uniref:WecB/TagA/CpsF family glycosyltransferase n=1 Tax=Azotosporobacter soli TaxID=3055040 RepID=UPI0031FEB535
MSDKSYVLNVGVDRLSMKQAVQRAENIIRGLEPAGIVVTANAEMVMLAQKDADFAAIMRNAALVVPDGAGVVWAAKYLGMPLTERVAGYDLTQQLLARAAASGYRVFFLGAGPDVANQAKAAAESRYPGINVVGTQDGFFTSQEEGPLIRRIAELKPDILFVALGVPRQEKWLTRHFSELTTPLCIGVGGTFDVMAGRVKRAPVWMQRAGLEWLFRLLCQPERLFRMAALPKFVLHVLRSK